MEHINQLKIKNFRCFKELTLDFSSPIVLIKGENGSGKTSILEALSYAATLRSFRTHHVNDLILFDDTGFFIQIDFASLHSLKTIFVNKKRVIKFDEKNIKSHKEISLLYHAITLTEDDLAIVQGGPEARRNFLDQILFITSANYLAEFKDYKKIVEQRNALLSKMDFTPSYYELWTKELIKKNNIIVKERSLLLEQLTSKANKLLNNYINNVANKDYFINLKYQSKFEISPSMSQQAYDSLYEQEKRTGRTLFGAHLDDVSIIFKDKKSKSYASRGQQKLLVLVLKIAALQSILESAYKPELLLFLLDDFLTDLDNKIASALILLIHSLDVQIFITIPNNNQVIEDTFKCKNLLYNEINL